VGRQRGPATGRGHEAATGDTGNPRNGSKSNPGD